jgi:predicted Holliday junction resolvase-like endonuclease
MVLLITAILIILVLLASMVVVVARILMLRNRATEIANRQRQKAWQRFQADRQIDGLVHQAFSDMLEEGRRRRTIDVP